jgi:hypothetical protein
MAPALIKILRPGPGSGCPQDSPSGLFVSVQFDIGLLIGRYSRCPQVIKHQNGERRLRVKVEWYGQAAFLLTTEAGLRIITDPYDPVIGYEAIGEEADIATVSHEHRDHKDVAGLKGNP